MYVESTIKESTSRYSQSNSWNSAKEFKINYLATQNAHIFTEHGPRPWHSVVGATRWCWQKGSGRRGAWFRTRRASTKNPSLPSSVLIVEVSWVYMYMRVSDVRRRVTAATDVAYDAMMRSSPKSTPESYRCRPTWLLVSFFNVIQQLRQL